MSQQTNNRQALWYFINPQSLRGQLGLVIVFSLVASIVITILVYYQSNVVLQVKRDIEEKGTRINLTLANIKTSLNAAIASNNAYIFTQDSSVLGERNREWHKKNGVFYHTTKLQNIIEDDDSLQQRVDTLINWLEEIERNQYRFNQSLDKYIIKDFKKTANSNDSLSAILFSQYKRQQKTFTLQVERYFEQDEHPKVSKLKIFIDKIIKAELARLEYDLDRVSRGINLLQVIVIVINILTFLSLLLIGRLFFRQLSTSLSAIVALLKQLARGKLPEELPSLNQDNELNQVVTASQDLTNNLRAASQFALNVGEGKLDSRFNPNSKDDVLGNALIQMRSRLQAVSSEDDKRDWINDGLAGFAELLRMQHSNFKSFGNLIISKLVSYLGATQGGIFISQQVNEEEIYLELSGCYAYNREKFMRRKILVHSNFAEGLLGQVFLEKKLTILNDVPNEHFSLSSGLGDGTPPHLLIIPLKLNDQVEGVMEISTFSPFETHHIEFIEKVSESITATVITLKTNTQTKKLLQETQEQASQLRAQEETMRQNNEELATTQEEMLRRGKRLESLLQESKNREQEREKALKLAEENARITEEKQVELQETQNKLSINQKVLEKALKKSKQREKELKASQAEVKEQINKAKQQTDEMNKAKKRLENNQNVLQVALKRSKENERKNKIAQTTLKSLIASQSQNFLDNLPLAAIIIDIENKNYKHNDAFLKLIKQENTPNFEEIPWEINDKLVGFDHAIITETMTEKEIHTSANLFIENKEQEIKVKLKVFNNHNQEQEGILVLYLPE